MGWQEGNTKERKHLFSSFFGPPESELSTVSREKGEEGSLFVSEIFRGVDVSSMSWAPPFFLCPLSFAFELSSKPCHSVFVLLLFFAIRVALFFSSFFLATQFLTPCIWFPLDQSASQGDFSWLLPLGLPTDLCTQTLSKPHGD